MASLNHFGLCRCITNWMSTQRIYETPWSISSALQYIKCNRLAISRPVAVKEESNARNSARFHYQAVQMIRICIYTRVLTCASRKGQWLGFPCAGKKNRLSSHGRARVRASVRPPAQFPQPDRCIPTPIYIRIMPICSEAARSPRILGAMRPPPATQPHSMYTPQYELFICI